MTEQGSTGLPRFLIGAAASVVVLVVAWAMAARLGVPFALEWQEPAMLEHVLRVRSGEPLYVMPTLDFAPFPYPPLFYWVGSLLTGILGETLVPLRLVSLLGVVLILGSLVASYRWLAGWAACGIFAATYGWTGFWLDVARVDSLALGLGAVAFGLALRAEAACRAAGASTSTAALSGVASALAVLAKQTQLGLAVALGIALLARSRSRRAGAAYAASLSAVLVPSVLILQASSDGAFLWTTVDLLRGSPFHGPAVLGFWVESAWMVALPLVLAAIARSMGAATGWSGCLVLGALALVATGWLGRAHEGGFDNTLLPVALASAFASAAALRGLLAARDPRGPWLGAIVTLVAMLMVFQDPRPAMPTAAAGDAYAAAVAEVEALQAKGEVWQPISALPSARRGYANKMAIVDLAKSQEEIGRAHV